jgi:hypothetical protein
MNGIKRTQERLGWAHASLTEPGFVKSGGARPNTDLIFWGVPSSSVVHSVTPPPNITALELSTAGHHWHQRTRSLESSIAQQRIEWLSYHPNTHMDPDRL